MVVVLPAPLGPSRPKHSARGDFEVEAVDGHHIGEGLAHSAQKQRGRFGGYVGDIVGHGSGSGSSHREESR